MKTTTNYGFKKPEGSDFYNVEDFNYNMDLADQKLKELEEGKSSAAEHGVSKENPHNVTKEQVGLGNVENVSTNNQTPTYTVPTELTELSSGEKLQIAMGKIAKAVKSLIAHIGNKSNPHAVTAAQAGAIPTDEKRIIYRMTGGTMIPNGSDLNTYIEIGNYYSYSNVDVLSFANCPIQTAFTMKVEYAIGTGYPAQTLRDYMNGVEYYRFTSDKGANWSEWTTSYLPMSGGTLEGDLEIKKFNNGSSKVFKNHSASADYGTEIADIAASGKKARLVLNASSGLPLAYYDENGKGGAIYGEHNPQALNNNILINSNFANPVNQRGKTEYNSTGNSSGHMYTVDRWAIVNKCLLMVNPKYVTLSSLNLSNNRPQFNQWLEFPTKYIGKYVMSAKYRVSKCIDNKALALALIGKDVNSSYHNFGSEYLVCDGAWHTISVLCEIPTLTSELSDLYVSIGSQATSGCNVISSDISIDVEWAKLELGKVATPYVARTYAEEFLLCQRYYKLRYVRDASLYYLGADKLRFAFSINPPMRVTPTPDLSDLSVAKNSTHLNGEFTFQIQTANSRLMVIECLKNSHGLTYANYPSLGVSIRLDAEL